MKMLERLREWLFGEPNPAGGRGFRKSLPSGWKEIVEGGWPVPSKNVHTPELDAGGNALERVEREIARLKQEVFHRWQLASYERDKSSIYTSVEIGGWDKLSRQERSLAMQLWVDWRGIDPLHKDDRVFRESRGPLPWEIAGISEREWRPPPDPSRDISF